MVHNSTCCTGTDDNTFRLGCGTSLVTTKNVFRFPVEIIIQLD